jgi:hypothetical protein
MFSLFPFNLTVETNFPETSLILAIPLGSMLLLDIMSLAGIGLTLITCLMGSLIFGYSSKSYRTIALPYYSAANNMFSQMANALAVTKSVMFIKALISGEASSGLIFER